MTLAKLPRADEVDGDVMEAARSLAQLFWSGPAVVTARLALESRVNELADESKAWRRIPKCPKLWQIGRGLRRVGRIPDGADDEIAALYGSLSEVAHGEPVSLRDAVELVERTQSVLDRLR